ncbi:HAD hydrolase-like protein [Streptosporangium sp. NPDC005286]|uniref:HAD hydrolase-like protein n=1 Tax=Streptosporangium sp. NPDC005286 TaxID=3154463 RepID=UPI0033A28A0E
MRVRSHDRWQSFGDDLIADIGGGQTAGLRTIRVDRGTTTQLTMSSLTPFKRRRSRRQRGSYGRLGAGRNGPGSEANSPEAGGRPCASRGEGSATRARGRRHHRVVATGR